MEVSVQSTSTLGRSMTVRVPEENILPEVSKRLTNISRTAKIAGFRPGKAPLPIVTRHFGDKVRDEVVGELLRTSFNEALQQHSLKPAGDPVIESFADNNGEGLSYTAKFEVYPEITPAPLESLKITIPDCAITDADVDKVIDNLRQQRKQWETVDRPAEAGDQVDIDFAGTVDGEPFDGGEAKDFKLVLGSDSFIPGFEAGLIGATVGSEHTLDLTFPEDSRDPDLAGKPVQFKVQVKGVAKPVLPEVTEEFIQQFGIKEGGVEAFREEVRKNITRERDERIKNQVKTQVMDGLLKANTIEVPTTLVEAEAARLLEQSRNNLMMRGLTAEQTNGMRAEMFEDEAKRRVGLGLILSVIIKDAGIKAEPARIRATVESIAASYEQPTAVVKWYYDDRQRLQEIESLVLEEAAVGWIVDRAQQEKQAVTFDALMNPRQTESIAGEVAPAS